MINGMTYLPTARCALLFDFMILALLQRLTEILENVVDVLDAHAEPNHLRRDANLRLLLRRELPVRSGRRMTRQRLGIAHIHHALEQAERIEALPARPRSRPSLQTSAASRSSSPGIDEPSDRADCQETRRS